MTAVEYIEASGVPESRWPTFREWFGWHQDRGLVGVAKDGDEIHGVAIARCLLDGQLPEHYQHSEDGENVFVDLTVTSIEGISTHRSRLAMKCLLSILWDRFGPRRRITFKRNGVYKEYMYNRFMRKAMA
jgi:hypothetical protein